MDDGAAITRRGTRQQLDALVRDMCQLIGRLETACDSAGPPLLMTSPPMTSPPMTFHQQALLWSFALLLAQTAENRPDEPDLPAASRVPRAGPHLQGCLASLEQAVHCSADVGRVIGELRSRLLELDIGSILQQIDPNVDAPYPLVHVFEQLMAGSDRELRRARGAYFTPDPIVQYVVRSVDQLLQCELGIAGGLSAEQPHLCIVDPACGSGAFLLGVLAHVRLALAGRRQPAMGEAMAQWMQQHRLVGIDVMPASCGAAEMLIEQELLTKHAWRRADGETASWSAYCANPLRDADMARQLFTAHVPVIVGNPPYSNFGRRNRDPWIIEQLDEYKRGLGEKKLNLDDDFIKFICWAQYSIDQAERGVVALVTNNTYLSGLTHRQMRASLARTFDHVYVLDLHGSTKKREAAPDGMPDENVFPIQQGVAIGLFVKSGAESPSCRVSHADLWGSRQAKLNALAATDVTSTPWTTLALPGPHYFFVPRKHGDVATYRKWPRLDEIFGDYVSGVQTKRDKLFVGHTDEEVEAKVSQFLEAAAQGAFESDVPQWLRRKAVDVKFDPRLIRPYMVAPFDVRSVYYEPRLVGRARHRLLQHLDADNVALVFMRQTTNPEPYDHFLVTNVLVSDRIFYSAHGAPFVAPLYLRDAHTSTANLNRVFLQQLSDRLGIPWVSSDGVLPTGFGARDVLHWVYAAVHNHAYRERYHELLCIEFPRIPWPDDLEHFVRLCQEGKRLVDLHLQVLSRPSTAGIAPPMASHRVKLQAGYPHWQAERLSLSRDFVWPESIAAAVWNARIGGYQVLARWLKQRRGHWLSPSDLTQLRLMIDALPSVAPHSMR